jgi:8-oxo-dGTP diphosphatase
MSDDSVTLGIVVVVQRGDRFLMIRRAAGVPVPGAWCFVGGAIEPGETEEQAVVREFHEEVGGHVRPLNRVWEYLRPDGKLRLFWWQAELLDSRAKMNFAPLHANPAEVAELRWCTPEEIEALPGLLESNCEFLRLSRAGPGEPVPTAPD